MLVVGIDTSESRGSVALVDGAGLAVERALAEPLRHAECLLPTVSESLAETGLSVQDVGAVCVNLGPGSFTGLRIGLATAKGLCQALGVPLRGVEGTQAYRHQAGAEAHRVCVVIASRHDMVYARWYAGMKPTTATLALREADLVERLVHDERPVLVVGSGAVRAVGAVAVPERVRLGRPEALSPSALAVARLGLELRDSNLCELEPLYTEPLLGAVGR
ncbi:MAG: tRNA (adenosine(37)-N6)-threonylcarbamoyltransferase complex dimerization subunit type 1 TsaB [Candidatus Bipolaricaulota bacterium]